MYKGRHHFAARLQERVTCHYTKELLEAFAAMLDYVVAKTVCKDLPWQRWDGYACGFALQHVPEVFKVRVAPADRGLLEFEGRDVGYDVYFVVGVHASARAVGARVADLVRLLLALEMNYTKVVGMEEL